MKKSTKIILFAIIVVFIIGMALYPTVSKHFKAEKAEGVDKVLAADRRSGAGGAKPLNVNVRVIQPETLIDVIPTATGSLMPDEEVNLTFETSGKITDIFFKEGTGVRKGDLLAKVNDKPLQAELKKLEAQIPLAEDRVFRQKTLLEKDAVSKEAYEQVTTDLEKLKADIELIRARISQTELRAPFDGLIGLRAVSEGAYASPTTVIAVLTKIEPLKLEFSVPERYANSIAAGTKLHFTSVTQTEYAATVYAVESQVDMKTRTLKARALYPNPGGILKPGRSATITIIAQEIKNALTVPNEAVVAEMGRDLAYIYKGGKAEQVELTKGLRTESKMQILKGIQPGDTLIVTGVMQLRNGMPITIDNVLQ